MADKLDFSDEPQNKLYIRLADNPQDILAAQRLRYQVFYEEMQAVATAEKKREKRDFDPYDEISDHLLVADNSQKDETGCDRVVGCYRLLRMESLPAGQKFYTEGEFDISALKNSGMNLLELGRSCVGAQYRTKQVLNLLWRGISRYILHHHIDVLFGCASFSGIDPEIHQAALRLLARDYLAPKEICPKALPGSSIRIEDLGDDPLILREARRAIPPLIKGYLRVGSYIGDGAYIDKTFNTIDVCIVLLHDRISKRYYKHYVPNTALPEDARKSLRDS